MTSFTHSYLLCLDKKCLTLHSEVQLCDHFSLGCQLQNSLSNSTQKMFHLPITALLPRFLLAALEACLVHVNTNGILFFLFFFPSLKWALHTLECLVSSGFFLFIFMLWVLQWQLMERQTRNPRYILALGVVRHKYIP